MHAIRASVSDLETTWAKELGNERLAELRRLLVELNELAAPPPP